MNRRQIGFLVVLTIMAFLAGMWIRSRIAVEPIVPKDELAPVIHVSDLELDYLAKWEPLTNTSAIDEKDGELNHLIQWQGEVNTAIPGDYEVLFWVEDASGNRAEVIQKVRVLDPYAGIVPENQVFVTPTEKNVQLYHLIMEHYIKDWEKIGFYYEDLSTGEVIAIRPNVQYLTASTGKLMVLMPLMDRVSKGTVDLNEMVPYLPEDFTHGTGAIKYYDLSKPGLAFSLRTLVQFAAVNSDNIAFRMLWRFLGKEEVYAYYEEVIGHETNHDELETSAADAAKMMKLLYYSEGEHYEVLRHHLKNSLYPILIAELLPHGITAHKVGFYEGNIHDTAIVYGPSGDYLLSIYTDMLLDGYDTIAALSLKIYDFKNAPSP